MLCASNSFLLGDEANNCVLHLKVCLFMNDQVDERDEICLLHNMHMVMVRTLCLLALYRKDEHR